MGTHGRVGVGMGTWSARVGMGGSAQAGSGHGQAGTSGRHGQAVGMGTHAQQRRTNKHMNVLSHDMRVSLLNECNVICTRHCSHVSIHMNVCITNI